jgi:predicted MFS family arabinose efflux permease
MVIAHTARSAPLAPLVLATMASQALLVVLSPTIVAIGTQLGASVGAVGQARSVSAVVAIATSVAIIPRVDSWGVRRLLRLGAALAVTGCAAVAASPTLVVFLAAHALVGLGFACLLSAGFAGVAAVPTQQRAHAVGVVASANALAWIVVNPVVGLVTDWLNWRAAQAVPAAIALAALATSAAVAPLPGRSAPPQLHMLARVVSVRRWIGAELIAYTAWTALLTFIGPFFITTLGVGEAVAGWLLASAAAAYFVAATRIGGLTAHVSPRRLVVASALVMAVLLPLQLGVAGSVTLAVATFCTIGLAAGIRTPVSSALGLQQLTQHPGAIMAARTGTTQLGYLLGAILGGAVVEGAGYATLGLLLGAGMAASAVLVMRIDQPRHDRVADDAVVPAATGRPSPSRGAPSPP